MLKIIFYIVIISFVNCGASTRRSLGGRGGITTINKQCLLFFLVDLKNDGFLLC